jgi:hypothetical protein
MTGRGRTRWSGHGTRRVCRIDTAVGGTESNVDAFAVVAGRGEQVEVDEPRRGARGGRDDGCELDGGWDMRAGTSPGHG